MREFNPHIISVGGIHESPLRKFPVVFIAFFLCFLIECRDVPAERSIAPAFYHWQTNLEISPTERELMDSLGVNKLYVKFFDVDLDGNGQPVPHAEVQIDTHLLNGFEIVPTVFITNRTFKDIVKSEIETLAENVFNKIETLTSGTFFLSTSEIQFDCDWTQSTRENYFYFLEYFKKLKTQNSKTQNLSLSATIRLHQLKFPEQTGIPPVNNGMLMFYNMGDIGDWKTENSILDLTVAEQYLIPNSEYLLHLDLALPIFKWGVVFRNGELAYLINDLSEKDLQDSARFSKLADNRYEVVKSTYLDGYYLYEGDQVRLEGVTPELLSDAGELLGGRFNKFSKFNNSETVITFYHLDTTALEGFSLSDFNTVLDGFK